MNNKGDKVKFKNSFTCAWPGVEGGTLEIPKGEVGVVTQKIRSGAVKVNVRALEKRRPSDAGVKSDHIVKVKPEILEQCQTPSPTAEKVGDMCGSSDSPTDSGAGTAA